MKRRLLGMMLAAVSLVGCGMPATPVAVLPQAAAPAQALAAKSPFANLKAQIDLDRTTADFKGTAGGLFSRKQIHIRFTLSRLMSFGAGEVPRITGIEAFTINRQPVQPADLPGLATAILEADQLLQILPVEYINRGPGSNRLAQPLADAIKAYRP